MRKLIAYISCVHCGAVNKIYVDGVSPVIVKCKHCNKSGEYSSA